MARPFAESELLACPNGITFDDRGDLYVVNFNSTTVVRITADGAVTRFTDVPAGVAVSPTGKEIWVNDLAEDAGVGVGPSKVALRRIRVVSLSNVLPSVTPEEGEEGGPSGPPGVP